MLENLNFVVFIGIIAIGITASKKIESDHDVIEVSDLQRLLKTFQDGNIISNHKNQHEKHHSRPKHGEDRNLLNIHTVNLIFKHNNLRRDKRVKKDDVIVKDANKINKFFCAITGSYGCSNNDDLDQVGAFDDNISVDVAGLYNADNKEVKDDNKDSNDPEYKDFEEEAQNDLELLLNDLKKKLLVQKDKKVSRCRGNRCELERGDRERGGVRCSGNRCELSIDDYDFKDQLRCRNKKCSNNRDDGYDDRKEDLRCNGNRCGDFRAIDDNDDDRNEDDKHDNLRCRTNRCKSGRAGDDDTRDDSDIDELRCKGNHCGRIENHSAGTGIDSDFKSILDNYGKSYKINDELDAIVLDVDNLENVLQTLDTSEYSKSTKEKVQTHQLQKQQNYKLGINKIEVVPGDNDKRDVPRDLYFKALSILNQKPQLRFEKKRLLPLTMKQKMRLSLQQGNAEKEKVVVPIVLDVNGLGQVNP